MTEIELKLKFQHIEDELNGAYEKNDLEKIIQLLADEWTILESSTGLSNKMDFINSIKSGKLIQTKMLKRVKHIQLRGNTAIVVSKGKSKGEYLGLSYDSEQWVTNIYKSENSKWLCIMTLEIPLSCNTSKE